MPNPSREQQAPHYVVPNNGERYSIDSPRWCSDNGEPLLIEQRPGISRAQIKTKVPSLWRYSSALALECEQPISMGEGLTPLTERSFCGVDVLVKCEWLMPTGSFKDRGASVMLSLLRQQGVQAILEDSSGNGGASIAAYAAAGGLSATIMAPASTSAAKTIAMRLHGAQLELVEGPRQATADAALERAKSIFYASHNWHPFFLEGTKTLAYELWEDLGFEAPDAIIVPCGAGSNVLGLSLGFGELLRSAEISTMPRIIAVQPSNCSPIVAAFDAGADELIEVQTQSTIAEGTAITKPTRPRELLAAIRGSGGVAIAVSEQQIEQAVHGFARAGMLVEPTAAQPLAALEALLRAGVIQPDQKNVLVPTGSGLKATQSLMQMSARTAD